MRIGFKLRTRMLGARLWPERLAAAGEPSSPWTQGTASSIASCPRALIATFVPHSRSRAGALVSRGRRRVRRGHRSVFRSQAPSRRWLFAGAIVVVSAVLGLIGTISTNTVVRFACALVAASGLGFAAGKLRTERVDAPIIARDTGPVRITGPHRECRDPRDQPRAHRSRDLDARRQRRAARPRAPDADGRACGRGGGARRVRLGACGAAAAAGTRAAPRLRFRALGLFSGDRRRRFHLWRAAAGRRRVAAHDDRAVSRGNPRLAAGHHQARRDGGPGSRRCDRRRADHRNARRHLGGRHGSLSRFRARPCAVDLGPASGTRRPRHLLHRSRAARAVAPSGAHAADQEMGGGRGLPERKLLSAHQRRRFAGGAFAPDADGDAPGRDRRPSRALDARGRDRGAVHSGGTAGRDRQSRLPDVVRGRDRFDRARRMGRLASASRRAAGRVLPVC